LSVIEQEVTGSYDVNKSQYHATGYRGQYTLV